MASTVALFSFCIRKNVCTQYNNTTNNNAIYSHHGCQERDRRGILPRAPSCEGGGQISNDNQLATNIFIHTYLQTSVGSTSYGYLTLLEYVKLRLEEA